LFVSEYGQVQVSCEQDNEQRSTPSQILRRADW